MSDATDSTAGERVHHYHDEPVIGCRCAERAALARGLTPEEDERMAEFFGSPIVHDTPAGSDVGDASDGPSKDVKALAGLIASQRGDTRIPFPHERILAGRILASDWLAAREAAARAEGWDARDKARPQYLGPDGGHYDDCIGWEDCRCASYPNPYRDETP